MLFCYDMAASREIQLVALALKDTKPAMPGTDVYKQWHATANDICHKLALSTAGFDIEKFKRAATLD